MVPSYCCYLWHTVLQCIILMVHHFYDTYLLYGTSSFYGALFVWYTMCSGTSFVYGAHVSMVHHFLWYTILKCTHLFMAHHCLWYTFCWFVGTSFFYLEKVCGLVCGLLSVCVWGYVVSSRL